jgi:hypothetical protein
MAGDTGRHALSEQLYAALFESEDDDQLAIDPRIRLIDLNRRSLVGGIANGELHADFLSALLDRFLGVGQEADSWASCATCTAQHRCTAWHSVQTLRDRILVRTFAPAWRTHCKPAICAVKFTLPRANCGLRWLSSFLACMSAANSMPTRS